MKAITLRLDDEVYEALRLEAFERRVSMTQIIRERLGPLPGLQPPGPFKTGPVRKMKEGKGPITLPR